MSGRWILEVGFALLSFALISGCADSSDQARQLKHYPIDRLEGVITQSDVSFDAGKTSDGNGSIRIPAEGARTVCLYETGDLDVEEARIVYQAKLSTKALTGQAYLEMWCHFADGGEYFSRSLQSALSGTNGWVTVETPFFLQEGQNPDNVRLNVVVDGTGTVWIDDIRLYRAPLK